MVDWLPSVGCACCCLAVFLVLLVAGAFAFRPKKADPEDLEGVAPAPQRGQVTTARLTNMGFDDPAGETVMVKPSPPPIPPSTKSIVPADGGMRGPRVVTPKPTSIPKKED